MACFVEKGSDRWVKRYGAGGNPRRGGGTGVICRQEEAEEEEGEEDERGGWTHDRQVRGWIPFVGGESGTL